MDDLGHQAVTAKPSSLESGSTSSPSAVAYSPLFRLPRQLRDSVHEYSFCSLYTTGLSGHRVIEITKDGGIPEPAHLSTCKILREEAVLSFYSVGWFHLVVDSYDPAAVRLWQVKTEHLRGEYNMTIPAQGVQLTGSRNWNNLKRSLRLHHSGYHLAVSTSPPGTPDFSEESDFIDGMLSVAEVGKNKEWEVVEKTLEKLLHALVSLNSGWAK
jgi:hypothetical protein